MKWWQYLIFLAGALLLLIVILIRIPGSQYIIGIVVDVLTFSGYIIEFVAMLFLIFGFGAAAGFLTHMAFRILDSVIEMETNLKAWQTSLLAIIVGLAFGGFQIVYMPFLMATRDSWVRTIAMTDFYFWSPWIGTYTNPPIGWGIYGFVTFLFSYYAARALWHINR